MRVVTSQQMAAIDRETIATGIASLELMERAGQALTAALYDGGWLPDEGAVLIVCGKGNNGGDGLVIARLLAGEGVAVRVLLLAPRDALSDDARAYYDRLPRAVRVVVGEASRLAEQVRQEADGCALLVDAVFGTGIVPPLRDPYPVLFATLNTLGLPLVAIDIPSGVAGDDGAADPAAIRADATLTVGLPKLGLFVPPGRDHVGDLRVVDIGFSDDVIERHAPGWHAFDLGHYQGMLPNRPTGAHKYDMGSLLVIAGSRAYGGAAHLCGLGALRSGVGLVTLAVPNGLETALRIGLPEAIVRALPETSAGTMAPVAAAVLSDLLQRKNAVVVGPGLGADPETDRWVCDYVRQCSLPLVVDADGLGAFSRTGDAPAFAHGEVVLTPHAGELARLTGLDAAEIVAQRFQLASDLARRWGVVLVLKGSPTVVGLPDGRTVINPSGDDSLARGGTGDVLAGVIGSLLAQGCPAREAALLGVLSHGLAGEAAAGTLGRRGVLVREIADSVAVVLDNLDR